ncbi:hypothetical protein RCL_jg4805.t1 [Rhizophagus clarus]|uniref:Uncharacterized protein n=1 Tax=Rhizophagus clarus TaxID=94130 RepID=A0A8H3MLF6_9GLOM|nr:hypothetical protein RCL_jg4805.t1 [Rhizophagus clarus]
MREKTDEELLENGEKLLKTLISSTLANLREIRFFHDFKFSLKALKALEDFLGNWKGCILFILTTNNIYEEENM